MADIAWAPLEKDSPYGRDLGLAETVYMPFQVVNERSPEQGLYAELTPVGLLGGILQVFASVDEEPFLAPDWELTRKHVPDALQWLREYFKIESFEVMLLSFCVRVINEQGNETALPYYESALLLCPNEHRLRADYIMTFYGMWLEDHDSLTSAHWWRILSLIDGIDTCQISPEAIPALELMADKARVALGVSPEEALLRQLDKAHG